MEWKAIATSVFDLPYYIGSGDSLHGEPTAVISEDGLALAEPLYESITTWLDEMVSVLGFDSIAINDYSITDIIGELVIQFTNVGFAISIPVSLILFLITLYTKGMLSKHILVEVHETINVDVIDHLIDNDCN